MDTVRAEGLLGVMYRLGLSRDGGGVDVLLKGLVKKLERFPSIQGIGFAILL